MSAGASSAGVSWPCTWEGRRDGSRDDSGGPRARALSRPSRRATRSDGGCLPRPPPDHRSRHARRRRQAAKAAARLPLDASRRTAQRARCCRRGGRRARAHGDARARRSSRRRRRPTVWAEHGEGAAKAAGDYLFARAFAQLARAGDPRAVAILAEAALALARGEALQRRQAFHPDTSVEEYLARCSLKTGKLFEAACLLGGNGRGLGDFGLALGVAFQIADDILDCAGDYHATGKEGGVDLKDGTPTLPLIIAARRDRQVWRALAGEQIRDALKRVETTGALEEARRVALQYAERARESLDGEPDAESLEALTHAVVER